MRSAFTLVETLVVMVIVALLAGLLFPVFRSAKEQGANADRAQRLHQIGLGAGLYDADWEAVVPIGEPGLLVETGYVPRAEVDEPADASPDGFSNTYRHYNKLGTYPFRVSATGYLDGYEPEEALKLPVTSGSARFVVCSTMVQYDPSIPNWIPDGRYERLLFDGSIHNATVQNQGGHFRYLSLFLP